MINKGLIVGGAHFAVFAVLLKLLGLILPCSVTCYYSCIANFLLFLYLAKFTFEFTRQWYLQERIQPDNRAVFITGCDTGFGHKLAKRLDFYGYSVFAGCLDENGDGAKELKKSCSKRLQILEVDVTKDDSVKNAADFVKENLGPSELWSIVNNAGILKGFAVELTDIKDFKDTIEVNAFGPVRVTKAFLPLLRQSRGRIVNVNSLAGRLPMPLCSAYAMSKHASVSFTECLRLEMMPWDISVISIEPEAFKTALTNADNIKLNVKENFSKLPPDVKEDYGEKYLKDCLKYIEFGSSQSTGNPDIVVEVLDEAVCLKYPKTVYQPCHNFFSQVMLHVLQRMPLSACHALYNLISFALGVPKPKSA